MNVPSLLSDLFVDRLVELMFNCLPAMDGHELTLLLNRILSLTQEEVKRVILHKQEKYLACAGRVLEQERQRWLNKLARTSKN